MTLPLPAVGYAAGLVGVAGMVLGTIFVLIGLVAVCIVQDMFRLGEVSSMTRSPVNFIVFAGLAESGAELWQVAFGSVIGTGFIMLMTSLMPAKKRQRQLRQRPFGIAFRMASS